MLLYGGRDDANRKFPAADGFFRQPAREWIEVRMLDPARGQGPDLDAALAGDDPPLPLSPPPQPWPRIFPGL
jgi:hypothetical protein